MAPTPHSNSQLQPTTQGPSLPPAPSRQSLTLGWCCQGSERSRSNAEGALDDTSPGLDTRQRGSRPPHSEDHLKRRHTRAPPLWTRPNTLSPVTPTRATPLRVTRGVLLGVSSAALATSAHTMSGGGLPDTSVAAILVLLVAWAGTAIADRHSVTATLALLSTSQLALHFLLTETHAGHPPVDNRAMVTAHVVATAITAVLLTKASVALTAMAVVLRGLIHTLIHTLVPQTAPPRLAPTEISPGHLLSVVFRRMCARRGPPVRS